MNAVLRNYISCLQPNYIIVSESDFPELSTQISDAAPLEKVAYGVVQQSGWRRDACKRI
jgi:hypothetical protein